MQVELDISQCELLTEARFDVKTAGCLETEMKYVEAAAAADEVDKISNGLRSKYLAGAPFDVGDDDEGGFLRKFDTVRCSCARGRGVVIAALSIPALISGSCGIGCWDVARPRCCSLESDAPGSYGQRRARIRRCYCKLDCSWNQGTCACRKSLNTFQTLLLWVRG